MCPASSLFSTVKYTVDIELLVLRSIFSITESHTWCTWTDDDAVLLDHLLVGLFFASTAKYTIDIELFPAHTIVAPQRLLPLV